MFSTLYPILPTGICVTIYSSSKSFFLYFFFYSTLYLFNECVFSLISENIIFSVLEAFFTVLVFVCLSYQIISSNVQIILDYLLIFKSGIWRADSSECMCWACHLWFSLTVLYCSRTLFQWTSGTFFGATHSPQKIFFWYRNFSPFCLYFQSQILAESRRLQYSACTILFSLLFLVLYPAHHPRPRNPKIQFKEWSSGFFPGY